MKSTQVTQDSKLDEIISVLKQSRRPRNITEIKKTVGFNSITAAKNALVVLLAENKVTAERVGNTWFFTLPYTSEDFVS